MTEETKQPVPQTEQHQPEGETSAIPPVSTETPANASAEETPAAQPAATEATKPASDNANVADANQDAPEEDEASKEKRGEQISRVSADLHQLVDLSTKYKELGQIVARIASRLGYRDIADRVVRLGLEGDRLTIEFCFVAARLAREEGRYKDTLNICLDGVNHVIEAKAKGEELSDADRARLLHLIRLAFAVLMFDYQDIRSEPEFTSQLTEKMKELSGMYEEDPFFHQLCAQALWFSDPAASEEQWEKAVAIGEPEEIWNSRGTWYKEASKNFRSAEAAYRRGLEKTADSALLMHNIAQILLDRAELCVDHDKGEAANLINEAEGFLCRSKRFAHRTSMRNHVFESLDRLRKLRARVEVLNPLPEVGDVLMGRVVSLKEYGVFIVLPSGHTGLLHASEIDHYWVEDASTRYNQNDAVEVKVIKVVERNDGGARISLSRKVLIEKPADFNEELSKPPQRRGEKGEERKERGGRRRSSSRRNQGQRRPREREEGAESQPQNSSDRDSNNDRRSRGNSGGGRSRGGKKRERAPQQYRDAGTGATIADLLCAKLNLKPASKKDD